MKDRSLARRLQTQTHADVRLCLKWDSNRRSQCPSRGRHAVAVPTQPSREDMLFAARGNETSRDESGSRLQTWRVAASRGVWCLQLKHPADGGHDWYQECRLWSASHLAHRPLNTPHTERLCRKLPNFVRLSMNRFKPKTVTPADVASVTVTLNGIRNMDNVRMSTTGWGHNIKMNLSKTGSNAKVPSSGRCSKADFRISGF
jgi:hypothetical protein